MTIFSMVESLFSIGILFHSFSLCLNAVLPPLMLAKFEQIYNPQKLRKRVSGFQSNLIEPSKKPPYGKVQEIS